MPVETHSDKQEAIDRFMDFFREFTEADHWMAAVWKVVDGRIQPPRYTTFNYPVGDMLCALGDLAKKLHESNVVKPVVEPLPTAFPDQWFASDVPTIDNEDMLSEEEAEQ